MQPWFGTVLRSPVGRMVYGAWQSILEHVAAARSASQEAVASERRLAEFRRGLVLACAHGQLPLFFRSQVEACLRLRDEDGCGNGGNGGGSGGSGGGGGGAGSGFLPDADSQGVIDMHRLANANFAGIPWDHAMHLRMRDSAEGHR